MSERNFSLAFIGAGNMAASLAHGLIHSGISAANLRVADPVQAQREKLAASGAIPFDDNNSAIADCDVVVLAVKPQVAQQVVSQLQGLKPTQLLVSIAAGINLASLSLWSNPDQAIVRCMPNTPALLGAGMSALFANNYCTEAQRKLAQTVLSAAGETIWVEEEQALDAVTAVSGSGPAYFFLLMEAMIDAGVKLGLSRDTATTLTLQTAYGAARMAQESSDAPGLLRQNVTSPGGTTAAALDVFAKAGFNDMVAQALTAANTRAAALAKEFGGEPE